MFSKKWLINAVLMFIAIYIAIRIFNLWNEPLISIPSSYRDEISFSEKKIIKPFEYQESSFDIIVGKNLFSKERKEYIVKEELVPEVKNADIDGNKIVLYGVIIIDELKTALINNPYKTPDEREHKWVKIGDSVGDFKVSEIKAESIIIANVNKKFEIILYDKKKQTSAIAHNNQQPNVVSAQAPTVQDQKKNSEASNPSNNDDEYEYISTPFGTLKRKKK
ncbi:MAG: hypothetical protein HQK76_11660 [Desulfobacterales bacterium]|nr:hypothetical protein [Desulfobacterales bacterium]